MPVSARRPSLRQACLLLASLLLSAAWPAAAIDESDLLPVDQAFALSAEASGPDEVRIRWKIADGYYLYRHRTGAQVATAGARAGALRLPAGEPHEDEYFGKTQTYRDALVATLPGIAGADGTVSLRIKYQGCADAGICYPPQTRTLTVALADARPAPAPAPAAAGFNPLAPRAAGGGPLGGNPLAGGAFGNGGKAAPLTEEQAFGFDAIADGGDALLLRFTPAPGYYLYRDRSSFRLEADGIAAGTPAWPRGASHRDEHFGDVTVYFSQIEVPLPLRRTRADAQTVTLRATFQGCQTDGICYPPMTRTLRIALPRGTVAAAPAIDAATPPGPGTGEGRTVADAIAQMAADAPAGEAGAAQTVPDATASGIAAPAAAPSPAPADTRATGTLPWALLLALLGGLILNLMPCVLPILSLKALGLAGSGESPRRARAQALWYTAGVLVSFVALGGLAMALREAGMALGWGFQLQQPLVVAVLALVMFAFGLSLSGLWHVGGRWTGVGHGLASRGGAGGDFFTGVLAVVVAAPCTAPLMAPALGWAFAAPPAAALLVFAVLGLGLALPFLLIGFVPALARRLPKPGAWMETFKQLMAFPMYATAIWLVWVLANQRGADAVGLWAMAALGLAFAAWAATRAGMAGARWGSGVALAALLASAWPLWSISRLPSAGAARAPAPAEHGAETFSERRLAELRAANRVVLVNMTADWCVTCKANERAVFARDGFRDALAAADAAYLVGDWTDVDPAISAYLERYRSVGVPLYVVYPRGGGEGTVLPTVLTPSIVREALAGAAAR